MKLLEPEFGLQVLTINIKLNFNWYKIDYLQNILEDNLLEAHFIFSSLIFTVIFPTVLLHPAYDSGDFV